jgi:Fur family ferric uptake transcriptional regulator
MSIVRKTKSVNIILSKFDKGHEALSVVDLVEELKEDMNKTTVYRILERLESEGTIHSFTGTNGLKWYAKCYQCTSHHHNEDERYTQNI